MKIRIIFLSLGFLLNFSFIALSQTTVGHTYDAAGNRLGRTIVLTLSESGSNTIDPQTYFFDTLEQLDIRIYPNPVKEFLEITINNLQQEQQVLIQLYDTNGRMILQQTHADQTSRLDLSREQAGIYILKISSADKITNWKIIKQ